MTTVIQAFDPATGQPTGWVTTETTAEQAAAACAAADGAAAAVADVPRGQRADWLRAMAAQMEAERSELVSVADRETGLGRTRLDGELTRTCFQLRLLADVVDEGSYLEVTIDHQADTPMGPRPDLRRMLVPLGPVAVFGASNFPFAFSVPGGDTASALAAGCPVVIKAHPSHPQTSQCCFEAMSTALRGAGAPPGLIGLVHGVTAGEALVTDPHISAVGFTGSEAGGRALAALAASRPDPIPFYGELSGLNPVVISPAAAQARGAQIASGLLNSVTLGGGQFCTKPGLAFVPEGAAGNALVAELARLVGTAATATALNAGIEAAFRAGTARMESGTGVTMIGKANDSCSDGYRLNPTVLSISAGQLRERLLEECFGPVTVVVRYTDGDDLLAVIRRLPGSLTATVHCEPGDESLPSGLPRLLMKKAGRLVWNGFPTGVAVTWAMQHGGPSPSTTNSLHSSVGPTAIRRFLRPVAWQDAPRDLLPAELCDDRVDVPRRIDGLMSVP